MTFEFNAYSALLLLFFLQGVVVSVVLLVRSQRQQTAADGWLALLLLLSTARLAQWMLGFAGWYDSHDARTTFMFYFPFSDLLAVGPALYFYFRSLTNQQFRFGRRDWWHFAPALLYAGWRLLVFAYDVGWWHGAQGQPLPAHYGTKGPLAAWLDAQPGGFWLNAAAYLLLAWYVFRTLRLYRAYARYLNDNFSDTDQIRFRWLRNVLVAVLVGTIVTLLFGLVSAFISPLSYYQVWYDYLFTGLLIYYLSIAGLLTGHRLAGLRFRPDDEPAAPPSAAPPEPLTAPAPPVVATSPDAAAPEASPEPRPLPDEAELTRWTTRLLRHMDEAQPYLAPELTLGELAAQLGTSPAWLSRVINTGCGQNFNDFINEYRVREAERRLRDPRFQHYTLLAVALEAGFNSKSTFNRVFKKLRGITPGEASRAANRSE